VASYRFCRPDDLPLLVRALADCWRVHFPAEPEPTVERFRREMKELDVWPSSCMVALGGAGGREPIAVLIGTRRPAEVLVLRIGVRPDHLRQGHGSHLLTSLSQKLAVLGPDRLVAEAPRGMTAAEGLLAACGYQPEAVHTDWTLAGGALAAAAAAPPPEAAIAPVTVAELAAAGALEVPAGVAWERQRPTLLQRGERLAALAVPGPERVEAWVVYEPAAEDRTAIDVWAAGAPDPEQSGPLTSLLLRALAGRTGRPLRLPKLAAGELPGVPPAALGFTPGAEYTRWAARARPL
jgi:hypothetical protein